MKKLFDSSLEPSKKYARVSSLDTIKTIAAFFVVFLHMGHTGFGWDVITVFSNFAVPFFFLVTGYYYRQIYSSGAFHSYFRKILILTLQSIFFYFALDISIIAFTDNWQQLTERYSKVVIWALLLFDNQFQEAGHLWYIIALIYVLGILSFFEKIKRVYLLIYASPLLLLFNYLLSWQPNYLLYRNFLFTGLPYVCIGIFLSSKAANISSLHKKFLYVTVVCLVIMLFTEWSIYLFFDFNTERNHYLMTSFVTISLFICAIRNPSFGNNTVIAKIGLRYSTYIYIYHKAVKMLLLYFFEDTGFFYYTKTFIIFGTTLFFAVAYLHLKKAIISEKANKKNLKPEKE